MTAEKRRQYGTGSVSQRKSDGRWIGTMDAGFTARGTRRRITVSCSAAAGEAECKRRLKKKIQDVERDGIPVEGVSGRVTVKAWAEVWLTRTRLTARPKTWATNRSQVSKWVVPTIGHKRLPDLTPGDVRAVANAIRKAGLSSSSALRCQVVLVKMLRDATVEGHPVPQRVLMVANPVAAVNDRDSIPTADALALLKVAGTQRAGSRWVAALLQGMRQGECLGLTWECVDLDKLTMDVSWQLQAIPYRHGCDPKCRRRFGGDCPDRLLSIPEGYECRQLDGALCLVRPKTEKGQRLIPLVPWMTAALTTWQAECPPSPHGLVWPRPDGRPMPADHDSDAWHTLQDAADVAHPSGRAYMLHEARHTTATLLLEAGVDSEVVKAIMGHSSVVTTRGYQHVSQDLTRKALESLAGRLRLA